MSEFCICGTFSILLFPKSFHLSVLSRSNYSLLLTAVLKLTFTEYLEIKIALAAEQADTVQTNLDGGVGIRPPQTPGVSGTGSSAE